MKIMKTVLERLKNPVLAAILAIIVGFIVGLFWGWVIQPVKWVDASPELLNAEYQRDYLRMTIDSFFTNSDTALAAQRWKNLGSSAPERLDDIRNAPGSQDPASIEAFGQLMNATSPVTSTEGEAAETTTEKKSSVLSYLLIALGIVVVGAVGFFAYKVFRPNIKQTPGSKGTPAQQAAQISQQTEQTDYEGLGLASPITQAMTTYVLGDDLYDESFSIESPGGEFLGEYGVGISDTIGVGDPKKVAALEIWLFDKNDIKTATKVLMSEHAYNDETTRQRLQAKGELVMITPKQPVRLETKTLQLLVTVADLAYGEGPLPPNSFFDRATLELAIWHKQTQNVG